MALPQRAAWPPRTEQDLDQAAKNNLLTESHSFDIKGELERSESANRGLAKDLASFSVDGGTVIIGVFETNPRTLNPVALNGLGERVEQIGLSRVDEPVQVSTYDIPSSADPSVGYLVIEIPVSGRAPHMVDGKYYSRGDKTNTVLSDAAVVRWHEKKIKQQRDLLHEARTDLLSDSVGSDPRSLPNLLLVANPVGARAEILMELSTSSGWKKETAQLMHAASKESHQPASSLRDPTQIERHHEGILAAADLTQPGEAAWARRAELVLYESGKVTIKAGGIMVHYNEIGGRAARGIRETEIIAHTEHLVRLAGELGGYGYNGPWQFVLVASTLGGAKSYTLANDNHHDDPLAVYRSATYENTAVATRKEILESPQAVVRTLVAKLLRSLGSDNQWPRLFT